MIVLNAVKQLAQINYDFIKDKFKVKFKQPSVDAEWHTLFMHKQVLNGLFKGMQYVNFNSVCSAIYPKLLGSYEKELHDDLSALISKKPSLVIDIGCAEGYYAVGLARLLPDSQIVAADISPIARNLCASLAKYNNCNNVSVTGAIDSNTLLGYNLDNALIICDCEGYEKQLFTSEIIPHLKNTCLIIETHDFIDISISNYLTKLFAESHQIKAVSSIDDLQKVKYYDYPELKHLDAEHKREIFAEHRPAVMEWLILKPKTESFRTAN